MKDITTRLRAPLYLRQWLTARFGSPVRFPPRSAENALLRSLMARPPIGTEFESEEGCVSIVLPDSRLRKPEYYHHLSRRSRSALLAHLDGLFRLQLWRDMSPALLGSMPLGRALEQWCSQNGIGVDGLDAVSKKFYRMRCEYARRGIHFGRKKPPCRPISQSAKAV